MKTKEEILYNLVDTLDQDNLDGFGVHESSFIDCSFPKDAYGYRVYYKDGQCFDITFERQFDENDLEIDPVCEYIEGVFDGFKRITLEEAIDLVKTKGVFI